MKKIVLMGLAALVVSGAWAITATKEYVDRSTNAVLIAANRYTDEHGGGGIDAATVTNVANARVEAKVANWALNPNPAPVTNLTPAISYTTAVSNDMVTADAARYTKTEADGRYARYEVSDSKLYFGNEKLTAASIDALDAMGTAVAAQFVNWSGVENTPTTISGYGITDAKIQNGTITLGSETLNPYSHVSGGYDGNLFLISDPTAGWGGFMWMDQTLPTYLTSREGTLSTTILSQARADSGSIATNVVAEAVTTYTPTNTIVSLNQSVQSVSVASGGSLTILAPSADVKDWVVYANCADDNTPFVLPAGQYYAADVAYTNALKAGVTALYFTSCADGIAIGRQEFKPITVL